MARVRDLWFSEVTVKDGDGKAVRDDHGRVVRRKVKSARHPDNGGSKDAKRWLAVWLDPDGNEKTEAFAKKEDAKAYADKMQEDAKRGEYIAPKAGDKLFGPLAKKYLRLLSVGALTRTRYESVYRNHVEKAFAHRAVKAPKPSDIVEWLRGPLSKMSDSVRATAYLILAGTFDLAVADGMRRDNPARHDIVPVPKVEPGERESWPAETVWRVRDEHPAAYRAIVDCEAGLGLRRGCAFGLAEEDIDFDAGKVQVRRQVAWAGGQLVFKLPKDGRGRTVPLSRGVAASVRAHMAEFPPAECTLPWMDEKGNIGDPVTVRLLFTWRGGGRNSGRKVLRKATYGKPIRSAVYDQSVWKPALSRVGILPPPEKTARGVLVYKTGDAKGNGQHVLRHFFQTALDDGGVSLAGRMDFMGHSRKGKVVTLGAYGHVTEKTFERARQAVDAALFPLRPVESSGTVTEFRAAE